MVEHGSTGSVRELAKAAGEEIISAQVISVALPDSFLPHCSREELLRAVGLDAQGIRQAGRKALRARPAGGEADGAKLALRALEGIKAEIEKREIRKDR